MYATEYLFGYNLGALFALALQLTSYIIVGTMLYKGMLQDLKERRVSKELVDKYVLYCLPTTLVFYSLLILGQVYLALAYFVTSVIFSLVFYGLALRFGSGGDYRILIAVSFLTPSLIPATAVLSAFFGGVGIFVRWLRKNPTLSIPWMVYIFIAYICAALINLSSLIIGQ